MLDAPTTHQRIRMKHRAAALAGRYRSRPSGQVATRTPSRHMSTPLMHSAAPPTRTIKPPETPERPRLPRTRPTVSTPPPPIMCFLRTTFASNRFHDLPCDDPHWRVGVLGQLRE